MSPIFCSRTFLLPSDIRSVHKNVCLWREVIGPFLCLLWFICLSFRSRNDLWYYSDAENSSSSVVSASQWRNQASSWKKERTLEDGPLELNWGPTYKVSVLLFVLLGKNALYIGYIHLVYALMIRVVFLLIDWLTPCSLLLSMIGLLTHTKRNKYLRQFNYKLKFSTTW